KRLTLRAGAGSLERQGKSFGQSVMLDRKTVFQTVRASRRDGLKNRPTIARQQGGLLAMNRPDDRPDSAPRPPERRGLAALLGAFMEAHNILWGELVGGLLVVGFSTALVIALWDVLGENPLFKFATFTVAVSAVYVAGLYTLRRWKLESTSRGLLL